MGLANIFSVAYIHIKIIHIVSSTIKKKRFPDELCSEIKKYDAHDQLEKHIRHH